MRATGPTVVTSVEQIHQLVEEVQQVGAFAFDVETRGILDRHPDMVVAMEQAWKKHVAGLKNPSPEIQRRAHENLKRSIVACWLLTHFVTMCFG